MFEKKVSRGCTLVIAIGIIMLASGNAAAQGVTWHVLAGGETSDMALQGMGFYPGVITINQGDMINWTPGAHEPHTVSFLSGDPIPDPGSPEVLLPAGGPDYNGTGHSSSGLIVPGLNYSLTFTEPGVYIYQCLIHPGMGGVVIVQPEGSSYPLTQDQYATQGMQELQTDLDEGQHLVDNLSLSSASGPNNTTVWQAPLDIPLPMNADVVLSSENNSQMNGTATLDFIGPGLLQVQVQLSGLAPDSIHPAHIHAGTCEAGGPIEYPLNNLTADSSGNANNTTIINGPPWLAILRSGWFVNVHQGPTMSDGGATPIACGDIVRHYAAYMRFIPDPLKIHTGDTIVWTQMNPMMIHTVTFLAAGQPEPEFVLPNLTINPEAADRTGGDIHNGTGFYNSGILEPGQNYSLTFTKPGTYDYLCIVHDEMGMEGKVMVLPQITTPVLTAITVSPTTATLTVGNNQIFNAAALDQNGTRIDGINITWTSSNTTVGSIDPAGNLTALAEGTTTVTASNGSVSGTASVTVIVCGPKGDLNCNGIPADAGDLVLMKRASIGEIQADSRYDLNNNGQFADAGDLVLMKRASIGEILDESRVNANKMINKGRKIFRFDTFGDETFWGDTLKLHQAIAGSDNGGVGLGVSPKTALSVGLKVDVDALPRNLVKDLKKGKVDLDDPATTLALLKLNAVVGVKGSFDNDGKLSSVGITCAFCHSTVDDSFASGIGHRLDGWANRDLNVGAIVNLSPDLTPVADLLNVSEPTVRTVLNSWGPGKFDAELFLDGKAFNPEQVTDGVVTGTNVSGATLLPNAFGLAGHNQHTWTGAWGSVPYWNAFVANIEMHGKGTFFDPRLDNATRFPIAAANGFGHLQTDPDDDLITSKLPALQFYQLSLPSPVPQPGIDFDEDAAERGDELFSGKAQCNNCHVEPLWTEPGWNLHKPSEIGIDSFQADRAPDGLYKTMNLGGIFVRERGLFMKPENKGRFYHDGRFKTLLDVVNHYNTLFNLSLTAQEKSDLVEYVKSLSNKMNNTVTEGRKIFRFDTFGDEAFWGDTLKLHQAIAGSDNGGMGQGVSPNMALAVGLKVDMDALPRPLIEDLKKGKVDLDDPATTLALLKLNAVVGVKGSFDNDGKLSSVGITCAFCHSTVDDSFVPGIGHRLDGWANRDLNVGAIVNLSPDLTPVADLLNVSEPTVRTVLNSWGPGKFDAELFLDGKAFNPEQVTDGVVTGTNVSGATLLPNAFGLAGHNQHTWTGAWGSVPYWNAFVANIEMHGKGTFFDPRLDNATRFPIAAANGFGHLQTDPDDDLITSKLPALQFYQLSLPSPVPQPGIDFDEDAAERGDELFSGKAQCNNCHVEPLWTEPGWNLHKPSEIGIDSFQADRAPDGLYKTMNLGGIFVRERGLFMKPENKGGFYHDGRFKTLSDVVNHYNTLFNLSLTAQEKSDLVEYVKSLSSSEKIIKPMI